MDGRVKPGHDAASVVVAAFGSIPLESAKGTFRITATQATYPLTVQSRGFGSKTFDGVAVTAGRTTTKNLVLDQDLTRVAPVEIGDGAWLGQNVVVGPGVRIGRGAVVGSNSVVLKDIPDRCVAAGAPARVLRQLDEDAGAASESAV